jgi:hypothetical protein
VPDETPDEGGEPLLPSTSLAAVMPAIEIDGAAFGLTGYARLVR